jgi:N-acetylglucosamine-6-phosphate deacetylase
MCSLYPARVLGVQEEYGRILPGYTAAMILLDEDLNLVGIIN